VVFDREHETGGIPRHSDHTGYGLRDLRRVMTGPSYARHLTDLARSAGAELRTDTMVTGWNGERTLSITSPQGRYAVHAEAIVLATGARERPRPARRIPGDRPDGVYTTGQLQNLVHVYHRPVGRRAVVVGAELVSWSAVLTLREAGCRTVLMTTTYDRSESYLAFRVPGRVALQVPVAPHTRVARINGRGRVESVELEDVATGARRTIPCDTVITTGDWVPDHELVRATGLDLDRPTLGPTVDTALRTSRPGVFGIGNLVHPVDTADIAALDGRHVVGSVLDWLNGVPAPRGGVRLVAEAPLRWVAPQILRPGDVAPSRGRLLLWSDAFRTLPRVTAVQDGRVVGSRRLPWPAAPGRVFRVPSSLLAHVAPTGGDVHLQIT
jgi:thioredoxin reductase